MGFVVPNGSVQISGDFDKLDPLIRYEAEQELQQFLARESRRFKDYHLHAHLKRLTGSMQHNPLIECTLGLHSTSGRWNVSEEGFGAEAAIGNALMALRYQIEKHFEMRQEVREKAEGRKAMQSET